MCHVPLFHPVLFILSLPVTSTTCVWIRLGYFYFIYPFFFLPPRIKIICVDSRLRLRYFFVLLSFSKHLRFMYFDIFCVFFCKEFKPKWCVRIQRAYCLFATVFPHIADPFLVYSTQTSCITVTHTVECEHMFVG